MKTFILNENWDIETRNGNIFLTDERTSDKKQGISYAIAQKLANKIRLFKNDAYYAQDAGINHFEIELKEHSNINILRKKLQEQALSIDNVLSASVDFIAIKDRKLSGEIFLELTSGEKIYVEI